jgi:hypothetical protein
MSSRGPGCAGCFFLACVLLSGAIAVLPWMERTGRTLVAAARQASPPPRAVPPRKSPGFSGSLNEFRRTTHPTEEELSYGFIDHESKTQRVTCWVDRAKHEREVDWFGYVPEEISAEVTRAMLPLAKAALDGRGYGGSVRLTATGATLSWRVEPLPDMDRAMAEIKAVVDDIFARHGPRTRAEALKKRGFLLRGDSVHIDYAEVASRASPLLEDCFHSLHRSGTGYNLEQYLGLFVAFFQEIRYELPPDRSRGKEILGLYVPSEVLIGNHGDCDSKTAAFCALWRHLGSPMLVLELPTHVLVGVALPPRADQQFVRIGARTFVLCEVAGPGKLRPGAKTRVSGHFAYTMIDPVREGFAITRGESGS